MLEAAQGQKMPHGRVKIIKFSIIQQICQIQLWKLFKPENQLVQTFYNTFKPLYSVQNIYF